MLNTYVDFPRLPDLWSFAFTAGCVPAIVPVLSCGEFCYAFHVARDRNCVEIYGNRAKRVAHKNVQLLQHVGLVNARWDDMGWPRVERKMCLTERLAYFFVVGYRRLTSCQTFSRSSRLHQCSESWRLSWFLVCTRRRAAGEPIFMRSAKEGRGESRHFAPNQVTWRTKRVQ